MCSRSVDRARLAPTVITSLPERARPGIGGFISFLLLVLAPILAASYYYYEIASDQYVSEFRFAVTESTPASISTPMTAASSAQGVSSVLGGLGIASMATAQNYIVTDYLASRQAVEDLESRIKISQMFAKPDIDWMSRFDAKAPIEKLADYWQRMVTARFDPVTGIATAEVHAFSAADARLIATTLVGLSEELVNRIAMRSKLDSVRFAENEVRRAEDRLKASRAALTAYRIKEGVIDPTTSVISGNVQDIATTRATLIQLQTELAALTKQQLAVGSPVESALRSRVNATREQLQRLEREVAKDRGGNEVLTSVIGKYEQLDLDRQYAQNMLLSTMQALDQARAAAGSQQLYLTPYVRPGLPDSPTLPRRIQSVLIVALASFAIWVASLLLFRAIRDRS